MRHLLLQTQQASIQSSGVINCMPELCMLFVQVYSSSLGHCTQRSSAVGPGAPSHNCRSKQCALEDSVKHLAASPSGRCQATLTAANTYKMWRATTLWAEPCNSLLVIEHAGCRRAALLLTCCQRNAKCSWSISKQGSCTAGETVPTTSWALVLQACRRVLSG